MSGASDLDPIHLLESFVFGSAELFRQMETLFHMPISCTNSSSRAGQQGARLSQILGALDSSLAGVSHHEFTIALFGAAHRVLVNRARERGLGASRFAHANLKNLRASVGGK